jgi:hypothetical protein
MGNAVLAAAMLSSFAALQSAAGDSSTEKTRVLDAENFGLAADGVTDDGPVIQKMLAAARSAGGPTVLEFPQDKTIYVKTGKDRYVFSIEKAAGIAIDGGGSTFLLDPYLRFMSITRCRNIKVRRLSVDFSPLPFVDGTVVGVDPAKRCVEVRLFPDQGPGPTGGPTHEDGEQAFFSMLWRDGPYGPVSRHYWTEHIEPAREPGVLRVYADASFDEFGDIEPGAWRMSVPVPGIAHRFGPGPCFRVEYNDTASFEDVRLWSAPWFGFNILGNEGELKFRGVEIRPKPGSSRLMSLWRDGFHVKGNRGSLLFEDCFVSGMNDDAFNISSHTSLVQKVLSSTEIEVTQKFPLGFIPWRESDTLTAADAEAQRLLGEVRVAKVKQGPEPAPVQGWPAAPVTTLELNRPIPGLAPGAMVWARESSNPNTTLRRCTIQMSCRLQAPVTLDDCDVTALLWFYSEEVEGPFPARSLLRNCVLRRGRGNPVYAVIVSGGPKPGVGGPHAADPPRAIHDIAVLNNDIWGAFTMNGIQDCRIENNRFLEPGASIELNGNFNLTATGNTNASGDVLDLP